MTFKTPLIPPDMTCLLPTCSYHCEVRCPCRPLPSPHPLLHHPSALFLTLGSSFNGSPGASSSSICASSSSSRSKSASCSRVNKQAGQGRPPPLPPPSPACSWNLLQDQVTLEQSGRRPECLKGVEKRKRRKGEGYQGRRCQGCRPWSIPSTPLPSSRES